MTSSEQVKAPGYPETESQIRLSPIDRGFINSAFEGAVRDHGNGDQFAWQSYAGDDYEVFTIKNYGPSKAPSEETDYYQMSQWILNFSVRKKTLLIDLGTNTVERYEGEFTVPASFLDTSDIVAAIRNYNEYIKERHSQGWDPHIDLILRQKGFI